MHCGVMPASLGLSQNTHPFVCARLTHERHDLEADMQTSRGVRVFTGHVLGRVTVTRVVEPATLTLFELNHCEEMLDDGKEGLCDEQVPRAISNGDRGSISDEACPALPHCPVAAQNPHPGFARHVEQLAISHGIKVHEPCEPIFI